MADLLLDAVRQILAALQSLGVPAALMGGLASALWGHVRATRDVDLLIAIGSEGPEALVEALAAHGMVLKCQPPVMRLGDLRLIQLLCEPPGGHLAVQVDLLFADTDYHREALRRRLPAQMAELSLSVLTCEDLILHKLLAGRIIDRADVVALLQTNRRSLDLGYLRRWSEVIHRSTELSEAWSDAFPGETLPPEE